MRFFLLNLESICTCEPLKKLKLHSPKRLVQFHLFEKLTRANQFQIELKTVWLPKVMLAAYHENPKYCALDLLCCHWNILCSHPKMHTMQTADCRPCRPCRPCRLCRLRFFFFLHSLVSAFIFDSHIFWFCSIMYRSVCYPHARANSVVCDCWCVIDFARETHFSSK